MNMKWIFLGILISLTAGAQQPPGPRPDNPEYLAESQLLTFRLVPKDGKGQLYMAGRKAGEINLNKNAKIVSLTLLKNSRRDNLRFNLVEKNSSVVQITGLPTGTDPYDIEVRSDVEGKVEKTNIRVNQKP